MNRLKELRNKAGISQYELGQILNTSQNTISKWEKGQRKIDNDRLTQIANYFHVSVDYLLGNDEDRLNSLFRGVGGMSISFDNVIENAVARALSSRTVSSVLPSEEHELLASFRALNAAGRQKVAEYAADLLSSGKYAEKEKEA